MSYFSMAKGACLDFLIVQTTPIGFYNSEQKLVGLHADLYDQLEKYSDLCINKHVMPLTRIWKNFEEGHHDGGLLFKSEQTAHLVDYVAFVKEIPTIVLASNVNKVSKYSDLNQLIIGKVRDFPLSNNFASVSPLTLIEVADYEQAIEMLKGGRINAIAGGAAPLYYHLSKDSDIEKTIDIGNEFVLGGREQWLQFSKKSKKLHLASKLQGAITKLLENGDYERILSKYYGRNAKYMLATK
jgi:hypothetical protein